MVKNTASPAAFWLCTRSLPYSGRYRIGWTAGFIFPTVHLTASLLGAIWKSKKKWEVWRMGAGTKIQYLSLIQTACFSDKQGL